MLTYKMNIAGKTRELPLCPISDTVSIGAFVIFGDVELTVACAQALLEKAPAEYDYIITAESKGIPLAYEMARQSGKPYLLARKGKKLYMTEVFEVDVHSITTESDQKLFLDIEDAKKMQGKKILIVDDVISTGDSLKALEELVHEAGGEIAGQMTVLAEGDAQDRSDIIYLEKLPVFRPDGTVIA